MAEDNKKETTPSGSGGSGSLDQSGKREENAPWNKPVKLEFKRFERKYGPGLSALFKQMFNRDVGDEYWEWKYYKNPAGKHSAFIALDGDRVVGEVASIPWKVKVGSKIVTAAQTCDIVLAPEHQGLGTFYTICRMAEDDARENGAVFAYGVAIETTLGLSTKILGFENAGPLNNMALVINPTPFLKSRLKIGPLSSALGAVGSAGVKTMNRFRFRSSSSIEITEIDSFDSTFDNLWREWTPDFDQVIVRDADYLNWRYCMNPQTKYRILKADRNGTCVGYLVMCLRWKKGILRGMVVDLMIDPGDKEVLGSLINRLAGILYQEKADSISIWMLEHVPAYRYLKSTGFVQRGTPHFLIAKSLIDKEENSRFSRRDGWYFTLGDGDMY